MKKFLQKIKIIFLEIIILISRLFFDFNHFKPGDLIVFIGSKNNYYGRSLKDDVDYFSSIKSLEQNVPIIFLGALNHEEANFLAKNYIDKYYPYDAPQDQKSLEKAIKKITKYNIRNMYKILFQNEKMAIYTSVVLNKKQFKKYK